jgi:hypothetical protein
MAHGMAHPVGKHAVAKGLAGHIQLELNVLITP